MTDTTGSGQPDRPDRSVRSDSTDRFHDPDKPAQDEQRPWYFAESSDSDALESVRPTDETAPIDPIWSGDELPDSWQSPDVTRDAEESGQAPTAESEPEAIPLATTVESDAVDFESVASTAASRSTTTTTTSNTGTSTTSTTARPRYSVGPPSDSKNDQGSGASPGATPPDGKSRFSLPTSLSATRRFPGIGRLPDMRVLVTGLGTLVILVALLASEAGVAILLASVILPIVAVVTLDRLDVFDREPPLIMLGISTAGGVAGILIGLLNGVILDEFWDRNVVDRIGAVGFAGELVGRNQSPPLSIFALAGVVIPGLAVAAILAAPIAARRWTAFRNEAMDGVLLGAAAGAGFAFGTALVHLWPLITGDRIVGSVADWTAAVLSIALFRSVILMTIAALVGLAIWQYDLSRATKDMIVPLAAGLGGAIAYTLLGLVAEQSGATTQVLFNVVITALLLGAARVCLQSAIDFDRSQLAGNRVVCPNCRKITPSGKFCAFCQSPLTPDVSA